MLSYLNSAGLDSHRACLEPCDRLEDCTYSLRTESGYHVRSEWQIFTLHYQRYVTATAISFPIYSPNPIPHLLNKRRIAHLRAPTRHAIPLQKRRKISVRASG
jgi:hypothetical protein